MKEINQKSVVKKALLLSLFLIVPYFTIAQDHSSEFEIEITNTKSGFELKSTKGNRWLNLSFSDVKFKSLKIDEEGMVGSRIDTIPTEHEFADYLIIFAKENDNITLIGKKGTSWEELSFKLPLNKTQKINQDGMIN